MDDDKPEGISKYYNVKLGVPADYRPPSTFNYKNLEKFFSEHREELEKLGLGMGKERPSDPVFEELVEDTQVQDLTIAD